MFCFVLFFFFFVFFLFFCCCFFFFVFVLFVFFLFCFFLFFFFLFFFFFCFFFVFFYFFFFFVFFFFFFFCTVLAVRSGLAITSWFTPSESILRCSLARLAHFNACAMNQARTQTFENGVWGCEYQVFDHDGGGGRRILRKAQFYSQI